MAVKAYYDTALRRWLFIDFDETQKAAPQILPDEIVKSLGEKETLIAECRELRKMSRQIHGFMEEVMERQRKEVERVPIKQQPTVKRTEPRLGQKYNLQSGHGVFSYVPTLKEKEKTLIKDVLGRKVSPQKMLLRLQWLTEEAMLRGQGS